MPTHDLDDVQANLSRYGCCVISDTLAVRQTKALRSTLLSQAEAERFRGRGLAYGEGAVEPGETNIPSPDENTTEPPIGFIELSINKGQVCCELLEHPLTEDILEGSLDEELLLSSLNAHITAPSAPPQPMHTDQWWLPRPMRRNRPNHPAGNMLCGEH